MRVDLRVLLLQFGESQTQLLDLVATLRVAVADAQRGDQGALHVEDFPQDFVVAALRWRASAHSASGRGHGIRSPTKCWETSATPRSTSAFAKSVPTRTHRRPRSTFRYAVVLPRASVTMRRRITAPPFLRSWTTSRNRMRRRMAAGRPVALRTD